MIKNLLFPLFFLITASTSFAQYPVINENRPRIYTDSARLTWLKNNIIVPGDCKDTYTNFLYAYNNWWINDPQLYLLGSDSTQWVWDWSSQWAKDEAMFTVFLFKITQDPLALKRCRFLARSVIGHIDSANFSTMSYWPKEAFLRQMSDAGDLLLDWCYTDFTDSLQQALTKSIYKGTREFMNTFILSASGNTYVSSHNPWNTIFCNQNILTLHHAAGLDVLQNDTLQQWFRVIYDKWTNGFLPCYAYYRDDDGGWNWGATYAMWSLIDQFQLFENMKIGSNKNYYADVPWVQNSINQYWYFIQPDNKTIHLGDGLTTAYADRVDYLHARIYNDPRSQWRAQYWSLPANTPNTSNKFTKLLYKDFNAAVIIKPNLPLNWWADKVGLSVSRSSWENDATMVTFFNSPSKRSDHEHRDNNSFTIFKNAPLLIDAGYYDTYAGTHYRHYYQRTIAHNSICVFDSSEVYNNFGQLSSNDGGQIESNSLANFNEIFLPQTQRGKWIKYATGSNYAYNIADAQLSYDSNKLSFFRRRLLFLKPGKAIVLDHVHLKNRATKQRDIKWIGHFAKKPAINGIITNTQASGHIETYNGNSYVAKNGNGSVAIKTLLPSNSTVTLIGGTSYEYWVNGTNYPPLAPPDTTYYTSGSWRIEVRPTASSDTVIFLHTISIGDSTNMATTGGAVLQSAFSVGADWGDTLYFFAADAGTEKNYYAFENISGNRTAGLFAADLKVGSYYVKVDGFVFATINTDSNGILQSSVVMAAGNHLVEIAAVTTGVYDPAQAIPLSIFPNPASSELTIQLPASTLLTKVNIYNSKGALIASKQNEYRINIARLPGGLYFITVKRGNKVFRAKFAILR
jgi:hypothetical protein